MRRSIGPLITLLSDFGMSDHYVAAMKGVILRICTDANLVDISHLVGRHNIVEGAYLLAQSAPYFPEGAIHLAVVDPEVGAERRRVAIKGNRSIFVGPDNGLLIAAARAEGIMKAVNITNRDYMLHEVSSTFEGRDVFASVAAYLALGLDVENLGPEVSDLVDPVWAQSERLNGEFRGRIVHIDHFGNLITNIPVAYVNQWQTQMAVEVGLNGRQNAAIFVESYAEARKDGLVVLVGSGGLIEIAVNRGSAQAKLSAELADRVTIRFAPSQSDTRQ